MIFVIVAAIVGALSVGFFLGLSAMAHYKADETKVQVGVIAAQHATIEAQGDAIQKFSVVLAHIFPVEPLIIPQSAHPPS